MNYIFLFMGTLLGTVLLVFVAFTIVGIVAALMEMFIRFSKWALGIRNPSAEVLKEWNKIDAD